ncbi:phosphoribosylaminoimidazole carboxylase [Streptococcus mitis]|nr:phosphoribosylaminoimidazole carboxylase [Streptococcus mitis]
MCEKVKAKFEELVTQYSEKHLAIYDLLLDVYFNTLSNYPSVFIWKRGGE